MIPEGNPRLSPRSFGPWSNFVPDISGQRVIMEELTEKQRMVMMAARIHDMPLEEVAECIGSNRNAVYKMLHEARLRLKRLEAEGLTLDEVMATFG